MPKPNFYDEATSMQRSFIDRLAEIEESDRDACAHCGGEDCACCEIYQDRMHWQPISTFLEDYDYDPMAEFFDELDEYKDD